MGGLFPGAAPYYHCMRCKRELAFADIFLLGRVDAESESFFLAHECWCTPNYVFERNFKFDAVAFRRLLGPFKPALPYQAAPGEPLPLRPAQERELSIFRWECQQLESVDEFLLLATRPAKQPPAPPS